MNQKEGKKYTRDIQNKLFKDESEKGKHSYLKMTKQEHSFMIHL